jgi:hypothetical protein
MPTSGQWHCVCDDSPRVASAPVTRLTTAWTEDYKAFSNRDLSDVDYVYPVGGGLGLEE